MKISYFLPIFNDDEAIRFLQKFTATEFFNTHKDCELIIATTRSKYLDEVKNVVMGKCEVTFLYGDKEFTFNDAFHKAVEVITGDVCLLLDSKISNIEPLLKKCMAKYDSDAKVVFVSKRYSKVKGFFKKIGYYIYKFFSQIFVGKADKGNIVTLGLLDGSILKILMAIPDKRCLLKNTDKFYGIKTATIYVDDKTKNTDSTKGKMTSGMWSFIWSTAIFSYLLAVTILLSIICPLPTFVKVPLIFGMIITGLLSIFSYPKHIFILRNYPLQKIDFTIEKI